MHRFERTVLWCGVIALAIFAFVINGRVNSVQDTVQRHAAQINKPAVEARVFPGVPVALAERWNKAIEGKEITPQDHLWMTVQITNTGESYIQDLAAELALLSPASAVHPYSASSWNVPRVVDESTDKTQVKITFPGLSQGDAHTAFVAVRPENFGQPPYAPQDKLQWADNYRLYWKTLTITADTAEEEAKFVQYGLASDWLPVMQQAAIQ